MGLEILQSIYATYFKHYFVTTLSKKTYPLCSKIIQENNATLNYYECVLKVEKAKKACAKKSLPIHCLFCMETFFR